MEKHQLNNWDLRTLIYLNFDFYWTRHYPSKHDSNGQRVWLDPEQYSLDLMAKINPNFFQPLLDKNPNLLPLVEKFTQECKKHEYPVYVLTDIFQNKIYLEDVSSMVFNNNYTKLISDKERKKFIKDMIGYQPSLMNDLHNHLKNNLNKDAVLLYSYAESLPKYMKEINDSTESIWENLKKITLYSDSASILLLSPIVKSFKHDESFYKLLKDIFSPKLAEYHGLREKFQKFEKKYFSQFSSEEKIDLFTNHQEYVFTFSMKDMVLVDKFGINKNFVMHIQSQIYDGLKEYLNKSMPDIGLYYSHSNKGLEINVPNFSDKEQVDFYMEKIQPIVVDILSSLPENLKKFPDNDTIPKMFETASLKLELEESFLELEKSSENKNIMKQKKNKL